MLIEWIIAIVTVALFIWLGSIWLKSKKKRNSFLSILENIMENGVDRPNRTGIDTRALFGCVLKHDMRDGFPAITTKKLAFKTLLREFFWFLTGSRNENYLRKLGAKIWKANATADYWIDKAEFPGDVGRIYGVQWRSWISPDGEEIDQVKRVLNGLENNPFGRRHIINGWNPGELDKMCLPPCHLLYQFHVDDEGGLHLTMYQRSCDTFLGVPFNFAHCGLFLAIFAKVLGLEPRTIKIMLADAHIYHNHFDQVREQLSREPKDWPELWISNEIDKEFIINLKGNESLTKEKLDELIRLEDYDHHPHISAPMAV